MESVKPLRDIDIKTSVSCCDCFDRMSFRFSVEFINIPCMTEQKGHGGMRMRHGSMATSIGMSAY